VLSGRNTPWSQPDRLGNRTLELRITKSNQVWGAQLDARQITMDGDLTEQAVAAYIAKDATKAAECVSTLDRRINPIEDLGALDELAEFRLIKWANMLGFRGHFSDLARFS
jgi:hypothetical protein